MIAIIDLRPGIVSQDAVQEAWGLIPGFLDEADPRTASEQFNAAYVGGWRPQEGFKRKGMRLTYPGDPPMLPLSLMRFRHEDIYLYLYLYPYAYVCIVQWNGKFEVCRMD